MFGCKRFHNYVYGKEVSVQTDHKPIEAIFKKSIERSPPRVTRMLMDLAKYNLKVNWIPGKEMHLADALSRAPSVETNEKLDNKNDDVEVYKIVQMPLTDVQVNEYKTALLKEPTELKLLHTIQKGWPKYFKDLGDELKPFWNEKEEFSQYDGIILKGNRVYVPKGLRSKIMEDLHAGHFGFDKTLNRARKLMYWPAMTTDIKNKIANCEACLENKPMAEKEPMIIHQIPTRAWQEIAIDFFSVKSVEYMVVVDCYSSYIELFKMTRKTSQAVQNRLEELFSRHGIPEIIYSDNGSPFQSEEYENFAKDSAFKIVTSSPKYPQSNGKVENAVNTAKMLIIKSANWRIGLMEYTATPLTGIGYSPAQLMFGRNIRTKLPSTSQSLLKATTEDVQSKMKVHKNRQKYYYDRTVRGSLEPLKVGQEVYMKPDKNTKGKKVTVERILPFRSYQAIDEDGKVYRRNRKHFHSIRKY